MNFYDWMIHKGLSKSSARSYDGALRGSLSEWAMDNGLISGPLIALTSSSALGALSQSIQELPVFRERNARGHHMYSATLSQFAAYLASNGSDDVQADLDRARRVPRQGAAALDRLCCYGIQRHQPPGCVSHQAVEEVNEQ